MGNSPNLLSFPHQDETRVRTRRKRQVNPMMRATFCGMILLFALIAAPAQSPSTRLAYDVATIKLNTCGGAKIEPRQHG